MGKLGRLLNRLRILRYRAANPAGLRVARGQRTWEKDIYFEIEKGSTVTIRSGAWIRHHAQLWSTNGAELSIGKRVFINTGTILCARKAIRIGDGTIIGPNVCVYDHDHDFRGRDPKGSGFIEGEIRIGSNVWLGANVCVLKNVTIGDGSVIAAGTVVTRDIPPDSIVYSRNELRIVPRDDRPSTEAPGSGGPDTPPGSE